MFGVAFDLFVPFVFFVDKVFSQCLTVCVCDQ